MLSITSLFFLFRIVQLVVFDEELIESSEKVPLVLTMGDDKIIPVKVAVRIRPISKKEKNEGCQTALEVVENEPQVRISWAIFSYFI